MKEKVKEHRQLIRIVGGNNESIYYIDVTLNQRNSYYKKSRM